MKINRFWARVKTISTLENGTDPVPLDTPYQDYVLDSGTTFSFLPKVMVDTLVESLNATLDVSSGLVTVDCVKVDEGTDMAAIFEFEGGENGGGTVTVPYEKFIIDARGLNGGGLGCVLGVGELVGVVGEDVTPVLGGEFLFYFSYGICDISIGEGNTTYQDCLLMNLIYSWIYEDSL